MKADSFKLTEIAKKICIKWNYDSNIVVDLNPKLKTTLGECYYNDNFICLNKNFVEKNSEYIVVKVLKHEIIHFKFPHHNKDFKNECEKFNIPVHPGKDTNIRL